MLTIMGATGNTGSAITARLLASGAAVRAIGRSPERIAALGAVEPAIGDTADVAFLTEAFTGADAVYTMLRVDPAAPDFHADQDRVGSAIVSAIKASGVRRVVALSSLGAERSAGHGVIAALHRQEQRLRALTGVDLLLLRPGLFFTTFRESLEIIKHQGVNADSVDPDVKLPMVDPADIADVAASALADRNWSGVVVRELLGPRDLSYAEVTAIIGTAMGRPDLPYVQLPYEEMTSALAQAGLSADVAANLVEMTRGFNEGLVASVEGRNPGNTTPGRFEDYAPSLIR